MGRLLGLFPFYLIKFFFPKNKMRMVAIVEQNGLELQTTGRQKRKSWEWSRLQEGSQRTAFAPMERKTDEKGKCKPELHAVAFIGCPQIQIVFEPDFI